MYSVQITHTAKNYHPTSEYHTFERTEKTFGTKQDVIDWLSEQYGTCKRVKMYCDKKDGTIEQEGWIYCFRNSDISHVPVEKWLQRDWVSVTSFKPVVCLV